MVGDKLSDLQAGWNAGCKTILVKTGYGREVETNVKKAEADRIGSIVEDLGDAVRWIGTQGVFKATRESRGGGGNEGGTAKISKERDRNPLRHGAL